MLFPNPHHIPFHINEALGHTAEYERSGDVVARDLANLHAKLAIADAIERSTKAIIAANEQRVAPF